MGIAAWILYLYLCSLCVCDLLRISELINIILIVNNLNITRLLYALIQDWL